MSTNNVAAVTTRRQDIPTSLIFDAHVASHQAGETIDGLVARISKQTGITFKDENDRKGFIAVLNVRRSTMKKKLEGEFQAERSGLEKTLTDAINTYGDASQEANDIRANIRELNKTEKTTLSVLELNRRGRTGDKPGMSLRAMLTNSILKHHATPSDATPSDATPSDATPADATPADATPADATPADATPADATPADATPADNVDDIDVE